LTYKIVKWTEELDKTLSNFYDEAGRRGFTNNSSRKMLIDSIAREQEWAAWILYYNNRAVGSVAAHRTCVFTDLLPGVYGSALRTKSVITEHQNPTAQFLIPACLDWAPANSKLYITSNQSPVGTQRRVHTIFGPLLERQGTMQRVADIKYRGSQQTVWQFFPHVFYEQINRYPRWQ
jgi:hypothetical protein